MIEPSGVRVNEFPLAAVAGANNLFRENLGPGSTPTRIYPKGSYLGNLNACFAWIPPIARLQGDDSNTSRLGIANAHLRPGDRLDRSTPDWEFGRG